MVIISEYDMDDTFIVKRLQCNINTQYEHLKN